MQADGVFSGGGIKALGFAGALKGAAEAGYTDWHQVASSKGVLLLHALRTEIGGAVFDKAMDEFGMRHGGTRVTSQMFQAHMERAAGRPLDAFFRPWLTEKGLPK